MTLTDPDYGLHQSRTPPEELLILSVLSRAILDLFGTVGLTANADEAASAKSDALAFLTQNTGGWAKRRKEICEAVGMDGDIVRNRVIRVLEGGSSALDTYDGRGDLSCIDEARALWEHEKGATERARIASIEARRRRATNPVRPKKPAVKRIYSAITSRADVEPIVYNLLTEPHTFRDLIFATDGDVSEWSIRSVLRRGVEDGKIRLEGRTYILETVPETVLEAATG